MRLTCGLHLPMLGQTLVPGIVRLSGFISDNFIKHLEAGDSAGELLIRIDRNSPYRQDAGIRNRDIVLESVIQLDFLDSVHIDSYFSVGVCALDDEMIPLTWREKILHGNESCWIIIFVTERYNTRRIYKVDSELLYFILCIIEQGSTWSSLRIHQY